MKLSKSSLSNRMLRKITRIKKLLKTKLAIAWIKYINRRDQITINKTMLSFVKGFILFGKGSSWSSSYLAILASLIFLVKNIKTEANNKHNNILPNTSKAWAPNDIMMIQYITYWSSSSQIKNVRISCVIYIPFVINRLSIKSFFNTTLNDLS